MGHHRTTYLKLLPGIVDMDVCVGLCREIRVERYRFAQLNLIGKPDVEPLDARWNLRTERIDLWRAMICVREG